MPKFVLFFVLTVFCAQSIRIAASEVISLDTPEKESLLRESLQITNLPKELLHLIATYLDYLVDRNVKDQSYIMSVKLSPGDDTFAIGNVHGNTYILNSKTGEIINTLQCVDKYCIINSVAWSSHGKQLVTASSDGSILIWDSKVEKLLSSIKNLKFSNYALFGPDNQHLILAGNRAACILDVAKNRVLREFKHPAYVNEVGYNNDSTLVITACEDHVARMWDVRTADMIGALINHTRAINSASLSFDNRHAITASDDETACLWDVCARSPLHVLRGHNGWVTEALYSYDDMRVITTSHDKTVRIWNAKTGVPTGILKGHAKSVYSASLSKNGQWLVTGGYDDVRIWEPLSFLDQKKRKRDILG